MKISIFYTKFDLFMKFIAFILFTEVLLNVTDLEMEPSAQPAVLHGAGLLDKGVLSSSSNSQSRHISILLTLFLIIYSTT